jgi:hypothetical protein
LPKEQIYSYLDADVLQDIYEKCVENSADGEFSMLIIDDFQNVFKDADVTKTLQKIILKMRHIRTSIWLLQQNFQALPKSLRELTSNVITYNLGKSQMGKIFNEFYDYSDKQYQQIMKLYKNPHDWLILNLKHQRLFFKFDAEVIFEEPEEKPTPDTKPK